MEHNNRWLDVEFTNRKMVDKMTFLILGKVLCFIKL